MGLGESEETGSFGGHCPIYTNTNQAESLSPVYYVSVAAGVRIQSQACLWGGWGTWAGRWVDRCDG
jgi:hypothetical protein